MLQDYAFFAMFIVQILVMSVLHPAWLIRFCRMQAASVPAERLAQLYPGIDVGLASERFVTLYRAVNTAIAVLGLVLLVGLVSNVRPGLWDDIAALYFMLQVSPLVLAAVMGIRYSKMLRRSVVEPKRKAVLQRRGLFDFVSPFTVFLAVLSYFLFVGLVIYIQRNPFPGFGGYLNIGIVTLLYAFEGFVVYNLLYGRKFNPLETHAGHVRRIGTGVKACVYSCIINVVFISLNFTLMLLDLQRWKPFATSFCLVTCAALCFAGFRARPREPKEDGGGSGEVIAR
jgi:hypothetical protein